MATRRSPHRHFGPAAALTRRHATGWLLLPAWAALTVVPVLVPAQPAPGPTVKSPAGPAINSAISPATSAEITFLLDAVSSSACEFRRNGSWYGGPAAAGHLRDKYRYFADKQQIASAEQFIERAATRSEMSGLAYELRCRGVATVPLASWLRDQLAQHRATLK
jgi:hypothetical protein